MVVGDFDIDFSRNTDSYRTGLFDHHALTPIDVQFGDNVGWTFENNSDYRTWIDTIAVSNSFLSRGLKVHNSDYVSGHFSHCFSYSLVQCPQMELSSLKMSLPLFGTRHRLQIYNILCVTS